MLMFLKWTETVTVNLICYLIRVAMGYLDRCFLPDSRICIPLYNTGINILHLVHMIWWFHQNYVLRVNYNHRPETSSVALNLRLVNFGQACVSVTGPMVTIGSSAVSATWFPPDQRTTATGFITGVMTMGGGMSFILGNNQSAGKHTLEWLTLEIIKTP